MANLKGSTFDRQIRNALIRMDKRGVKRYGTSSKLTHSNALYTKREMYLRDFAKYLSNKGIEGKMNSYFEEKHLNEFLNERLSELSPKSALDYSSGFSSMLQGLEQKNVSIDRSAFNVLREHTSDYRREFNEVKGSFESGRAISDVKTFLSDLEKVRESSSVIAELQISTGLRVSEAMEVVRDFDSYYQPLNSEIMGVIGKGGQEYQPKIISVELAEKLNNLKQIPSYGTYYKDLKELGEKPHNLRITFAKNYYQELREKGYSHSESLKKTSEELNHHRTSITNYYLNRA